MTLGDWLVTIVTVLYASAAVAYASDRQWPNVIIFVGYAIANIGVIWMAVGGEHGKINRNIPRITQSCSEDNRRGACIVSGGSSDAARSAEWNDRPGRINRVP